MDPFVKFYWHVSVATTSSFIESQEMGLMSGTAKSKANRHQKSEALLFNIASFCVGIILQFSPYVEVGPQKAVKD